MDNKTTTKPLTYKQLSDEMLEVFNVAEDICNPPVIKLVALKYWKYVDGSMFIPNLSHWSTYDTDDMIEDAKSASVLVADLDQRGSAFYVLRQPHSYKLIATLRPIFELTRLLTKTLPRTKEHKPLIDKIFANIFPNNAFPNKDPWTGFDHFLDSLKAVDTNFNAVLNLGADKAVKGLKPILPPKARHSSLTENLHPQ